MINNQNEFSISRGATMSINVSSVMDGIKEMASAEEREAGLRDSSIQAALAALQDASTDLDLLRNRVNLATRVDSGIRCALPVIERPDCGFSLPGEIKPRGMVLASDGSQISPDRTDSLYFGLINSGIIRWPPDGSTPTTACATKIYHHDDLFLPDNSLIGDELFHLMRDVFERIELLRQALLEEQPAVALIDGPIELYRAPGSTSLSKDLMAQYLDYLREFSRKGGITAGYIDKPASTLVVRMMELFMLPDDQIEKARAFHPLGRINDSRLFRLILAPGERSAVFQVQSTSTDYYPGELALNFFYLNVSKYVERPWIARVEIPAWVAEDQDMLDILHATLLHQCRLMGKRPYPYVLFRAHEVAVVTREIAEQIRQMAVMEYRRKGLELEERSVKQELKELG